MELNLCQLKFINDHFTNKKLPTYFIIDPLVNQFDNEIKIFII